MSLTPQDNARSSFSQAQANQASRHVFQAQPQIPNPVPAQRQQQIYRQVQGVGGGGGGGNGIRPTQSHQSPYATPYTPNNGQAGPSRMNGNGNNGNNISAEQQIAQGILSNPAAGSGTNTPQRRPPPLGTTIHMPAHGTPQMAPMGINHAMSVGMAQQAQRNSQNSSPALGNHNGQRPSMNHSPAIPNMGLQQQQQQHNNGDPSQQQQQQQQDLSMIDPQLAIDQQLSEGNSMLGHQQSPSPPDIIQGEMLSAPPGGSYPTFEALFAAAQSHALAHGYAFVIGRSKRDNRGLKKVFLICDRGGNNKEKVPGEQRQRKTKSRKCGCEFGVFGLENKTAWILRGRIDGEHLTHNHPPSESPTEHPGARKLDPKAIAAVKALEINGVSVKETLEILHRENPSVRYLPRDIYNARAAIKRDPSRVDATSMEELPTFYKKPPLTFEEKLRAELRTEVAKAQSETEQVREQWKKEVEELREELRNKDKMIQKFEMFIDICNERVMVQRSRLETEGGPSASG